MSADTYGDVTGEYLALRRGAGLATVSHEVVWVRGPDAVSFLQGLLTQDLDALAAGGVARSFLLEPRGKLRALLWMLRGDGQVGLVTDPGSGEVVVADLRRFRLRVEAEIDEPRPVSSVIGPDAAGVLAAAGLSAPEGWEGGPDGFCAAAPLGPLPRWLIGGADPDRLARAGATPAGDLALTAVRIEAGEPRMGADLDEGTIPQESGLVPAAVSFTKGCFLGQELVARIDSRGRVNRHLRGLTVTTNVLPPPGAEVVGAGRSLGTLGSVGESLALQAPVALALLRREAEPGMEVEIRWEGGSAPALVAALPLDDFEEFTGS